MNRLLLLFAGSLFTICMALPLQAAQSGDSAERKSGYAGDPALEGPDSIEADLALDDLDLGSVFRPPLLDGAFQPWFDAKRKLNEKLGLKLQFSYQALYQTASKTTTGEDEAAAGRAEVQGSWTLLGRNSKNPGTLTFRVEDRHRLGTDIPPSQLGRQFGSASLSGTGFSDFEFAVTEVAWRQTLADGRMRLGFGKISASSWYNAHALSASKRGFQNSALQTSSSKPVPGRSLGAVSGFRLGDDFALIAGIHDANGRSSENPFDTIDEKEFFYSAELRWFPTTFDRRLWDQVRMNFWYQDSRDDLNLPSGQGATFVASRLFDDFYMPFVSGGLSDGDATTMEADLTAGIALAFNTKHRAARDVLAFAASWGKPSDRTQQEQYTSELFYRFQLFKNVALTPAVQYIVDPARDATVDDVWIGGLRARVTL